MRKLIYHSQHILSNACPATQLDPLCKDQFFSSTSQKPTLSTTFSQCLFSECSSTTGGAICVDGRGVSFLNVRNCIFTLCSSTAGAGGAIFSRSISSVEVKNSLFSQCKSKGTTGGEYDGGGICMYSISSPYVSSSSFINNFSQTDAAGICIESSNGPIQQIILDSRFVKCTSEGISADGAGIHMYNNRHTFGVSNCFFAFCTSTSDGGAIFLSIHSTPIGAVIRFCFFHANHASNGGRDIFFYRTGSNERISLSYTTSPGEKKSLSSELG